MKKKVKDVRCEVGLERGFGRDEGVGVGISVIRGIGVIIDVMRA